MWAWASMPSGYNSILSFSTGQSWAQNSNWQWSTLDESSKIHDHSMAENCIKLYRPDEWDAIFSTWTLALPPEMIRSGVIIKGYVAAFTYICDSNGELNGQAPSATTKTQFTLDSTGKDGYSTDCISLYLSTRRLQTGDYVGFVVHIEQFSSEGRVENFDLSFTYNVAYLLGL